jgi:DNA-binding beta-propeller fold protein YncE
MAPDINNPGGVKNAPDEIRDGVVSDATRFPGGFIDEQITEAGAAVQIVGQFQLDNASFFQSFDVSPQESNPTGLAFKPDGSQLYVVGTTNDNVYQYGLSTAFDVSTASFSQSFDVSPQDGFPSGLVFKPDGSQLYVVGSGNAKVSQYAVGFVGAELG